MADNRAVNLEWCNNSMNQIHAYKHGLNWHRENAGRPKRPLILTDIKTGKEYYFESRKKAAMFLGGEKYETSLGKVLSTRFKNYKTIKGYSVKDAI